MKLIMYFLIMKNKELFYNQKENFHFNNIIKFIFYKKIKLLNRRIKNIRLLLFHLIF
jgi:hypothetical protein